MVQKCDKNQRIPPGIAQDLLHYATDKFHKFHHFNQLDAKSNSSFYQESKTVVFVIHILQDHKYNHFAFPLKSKQFFLFFHHSLNGIWLFAF